MKEILLRSLVGPEIRQKIEDFAHLLIDCVEGGASLGFMLPISDIVAREFWQKVAEEVDRRQRLLFALFLGPKIVGSCQLLLDMPPNQTHRAEIAKMLVHSSMRRKGLGQVLLIEAEKEARSLGRYLLVLDTDSYSSAAAFYRRMGWIEVGSIPDYAAMPDGPLAPTTIFYKDLRALDGADGKLDAGKSI